jgi:hypothetical protein
MIPTLFVQESILTRPVRAAGPDSDQVSVTDRFVQGAFALVETAFLPQLDGYAIDAGCGISLRDCGLVRFLSPIRPDELEEPIIRLRTESMTTELLARATLPSYFGFRPNSWRRDDQSGYDALVIDELAGLVPTESEFCEDVTRAWFVLTGVPFLSHILGVPRDATTDERSAVTDLIHNAFETGLEQAAVNLAADGADTEMVKALFNDVASVLTGDERLGVPQLFRRCGIDTGFRSVNWLT